MRTYILGGRLGVLLAILFMYSITSDGRLITMCISLHSRLACWWMVGRSISIRLPRGVIASCGMACGSTCLIVHMIKPINLFPFHLGRMTKPKTLSHWEAENDIDYMLCDFGVPALRAPIKAILNRLIEETEERVRKELQQPRLAPETVPDAA